MNSCAIVSRRSVPRPCKSSPIPDRRSRFDQSIEGAIREHRSASRGRGRKRDATGREKKGEGETRRGLACEDSASYSKCERMQIPHLMSGIFKEAERWM